MPVLRIDSPGKDETGLDGRGEGWVEYAINVGNINISILASHRVIDPQFGTKKWVIHNVSHFEDTNWTPPVVMFNTREEAIQFARFTAKAINQTLSSMQRCEVTV